MVQEPDDDEDEWDVAAGLEESLNDPSPRVQDVGLDPQLAAPSAPQAASTDRGGDKFSESNIEPYRALGHSRPLAPHFCNHIEEIKKWLLRCSSPRRGPRDGTRRSIVGRKHSCEKAHWINCCWGGRGRVSKEDPTARKNLWLESSSMLQHSCAVILSAIRMHWEPNFSIRSSPQSTQAGTF